MSLGDTAAAIRDGLGQAGLGPNTTTLVITGGAMLVAFVLATCARWLIEKHLRRLAGRTRTKLDDIVLHALDGPLILLATIAGAALGLLASPTSGPVQRGAQITLSVLAGVALVTATARLASSAITTYGARTHLGAPTRALLRRLAVALIVTLGAVLILDSMGVRVTPLLTTLGLAGLALALALQDTLTNFFSGVYVQADRPISEGHYVRIEDANVEGYVQEVGWRTTKIRTLGNNLVVIPNAKVAASVVTDYDLPEPRMSLLVRIPIDTPVDTRRAESIILTVAKETAGKVDGLLATPEPFVRFIPGFTEYGCEFTLICQVETFVDQYLAQHELRHRIAARLQQEGMRLGSPRRLLVSETATPTRVQPTEPAAQKAR